MLPKGRVLGIDTEPDMVKYLAERAHRAGSREGRIEERRLRAGA